MQRGCFAVSGLRCLFQPCAAVGYADRAEKQALGCRGLGPGQRVQTRPEEAAGTCPKTKPESQVVCCQRTGKQQPTLETSLLTPSSQRLRDAHMIKGLRSRIQDSSGSFLQAAEIDSRWGMNQSLHCLPKDLLELIQDSSSSHDSLTHLDELVLITVRSCLR